MEATELEELIQKTLCAIDGQPIEVVEIRHDGSRETRFNWKQMKYISGRLLLISALYEQDMRIVPLGRAQPSQD